MNKLLKNLIDGIIDFTSESNRFKTKAFLYRILNDENVGYSRLFSSIKILGGLKREK